MPSPRTAVAPSTMPHIALRLMRFTGAGASRECLKSSGNSSGLAAAIGGG